MNNLTRRNIRYICFRLQTEASGGDASIGNGIMTHAKEIKKHMESQSNFGGWKNFGITWDVDNKAFLVVVLLTKSIESEWNIVVESEAKELPKTKEKKKNGGKTHI